MTSRTRSTTDTYTQWDLSETGATLDDTVRDRQPQNNVELNQPIPCDNIRVEAPTDLPGGYQMETELAGRPIIVTVPKGGVVAGEVFTPAAACVISDIHVVTLGGGKLAKANNNIPVGAWRDGFWDICILGPCHATVWNSCVCPLLAAAQVITRLQLTWYGTPASNVAQVSVAFQILVMILVAYCALRAFLFLIYAYLDPNADPTLVIYIEPPASYFFFTALDDLMFYLYVALLVTVLRNIRRHLRARYSIPESDSPCCRRPGCEDVCCSLLCPCFTVAQMMRHTADYQMEHGVCCSTTGLVKDAHTIV